MTHEQGKNLIHQLGFRDHELPPELEARKHTPVHLRPKTRLVPMKVLGMGMPRTGTSSLREAMFQLGYKDCHHMKSMDENTPGEDEVFFRAMQYKFEGKGKPMTKEDWDQMLGYCECVMDYPCSIFAEELIAAYPDTKVVLTIRDSPQVWHKSVLESVWAASQMSWVNQRGIIPSIKRLFYTPSSGDQMRRGIWNLVWGGPDYFPDHGAEFYVNQIEKVKKLVKPENLLLHNAKEGWAPLCEFLGVPTPDTSYPRINEGALYQDFIQARSKVIKQEERSVYSALSVIGAGMIGLASYYYMNLSSGF